MVTDQFLDEMTQKWRDCAEKEWNHGKNRLLWVTKLDHSFVNWVFQLSFEQIEESEGVETYFYDFKMKDGEEKPYTFTCFYHVPDENYLMPRNSAFSETEKTFFFTIFHALDIFTVFQEAKEDE